MREFLGFLGAMLLVIAALTAALILVLVIAISRPVGRSSCASWARATGIPTKFVVLNWADTGTCLAQTRDGKWVKNTQLRELVGQ